MPDAASAPVSAASASACRSAGEQRSTFEAVGLDEQPLRPFERVEPCGDVDARPPVDGRGEAAGFDLVGRRLLLDPGAPHVELDASATAVGGEPTELVEPVLVAP